MSVETAIQALEEVSRIDLERVDAAIRANDKESGMAAIERVFAKIDSVIDLLRSTPRSRSAPPLRRFDCARPARRLRNRPDQMHS